MGQDFQGLDLHGLCKIKNLSKPESFDSGFFCLRKEILAISMVYEYNKLIQ